jgi:hypothetical protein
MGCHLLNAVARSKHADLFGHFPHESLLGDEPFRRRHRTSAEIVMPGAGNAHEALGRLDKAVQPFAERHWDDSVVLGRYSIAAFPNARTITLDISEQN